MGRIIGFGGLGVFVLVAGLVGCGSEVEQETEAPMPVSPDRTETPEPEKPVVAPAPVAPLCNAQEASYEPQRPKSNIVFVVDRSGSMQIKLPNGSTRWAATRDALFKMVEQMPAMNARASVMQFPQGDPTVNSCCKIDASNAVACTCTAYPAPAKRCDPGTYKGSAPADLNGDAIQAIKQSVNASNTGFYWGTPLAAAEMAAVNLQKASTNDGVNSIVFLTDGAPTSCDTTANPNANDPQLVIDAAKAGMTAANPIRTFVIGVVDGANGNDARPDILSKVAEAGGTARSATCAANNSCFYSASAAQLQQDIGDALADIARQATDCTFDLPKSTATTDLTKVNVTVNGPDGAKTVARDVSHAQGWDFQKGDTQIKLYGDACQTLREDDKVKVNVVIGCDTVTSP